MRRIRKGDWGYSVGGIPKGCKMCIEGKKSVVFITGKCNKPSFCSWYCPISLERRDKDTLFVNERPIEDVDELIDEIYKNDSKGVGITGGEPLLKLDVVLETIRELKNAFGESFHIHLYTNGTFLNGEVVYELYRVGLDELRVHLPSKRNIELLKYSSSLGISSGYEIPSIPLPEYEIRGLILELEKEGIEFININELEVSEGNYLNLIERGLKLSKRNPFSVEGSEDYALSILKWARENTSNIKVHYCPTWVKDSVQLRKRYLRKALRIRKRYEVVTRDGLIRLGVLIPKDESKLDQLFKKIKEEFKLNDSMIFLNRVKNRIEMNASFLIKNLRILKGIVKSEVVKIGIVEEYPTYRRDEVNFSPLN
ncbi:MAG: radical SAM protein [Candidatus Asgardarchaeia archaeon]